MTKRITAIAIAGLIVVQLITLSRISALQQELQNTRNQLSSENQNIRSEVSNIYHNVDELLEKQVSLLDDYDYQIGDLDVATLSVPLNFTIFPKQLSESETAMLYVNGQEVMMGRQWSLFNGTVDVSLFDDLEARVVLSDMGVQRSETLRLVRPNLRERFLPVLFAHYQGRSSYNDGEYEMDGLVVLEGKGITVGGIFMEAIELLVSIDGQVIDRIAPISINEKYNDDIAEMREFLMQEFILENTYGLELGQILRFTVVAHDSLGLVHSIVVHEAHPDAAADTMVNVEEYMNHSREIITDKQGNVLEGPQEYVLVQ